MDPPISINDVYVEIIKSQEKTGTYGWSDELSHLFIYLRRRIGPIGRLDDKGETYWEKNKIHLFWPRGKLPSPVRGDCTQKLLSPALLQGRRR